MLSLMELQMCLVSDTIGISSQDPLTQQYLGSLMNRVHGHHYKTYMLIVSHLSPNHTNIGTHAHARTHTYYLRFKCNWPVAYCRAAKLRLLNFLSLFRDLQQPTRFSGGGGSSRISPWSPTTRFSGGGGVVAEFVSA